MRGWDEDISGEIQESIVCIIQDISIGDRNGTSDLHSRPDTLVYGDFSTIRNGFISAI